ncbi:MAG: monovalent cation/H+ antiporter complex subunit F [Chloroflexota bacterium]|nr:MAG: cation transporter [Chloroflexota bacterium]
MTEFVNLMVNTALVILVITLILATYRIWRGPSAMERLQALDLTSSVLVAVIVVLGIVLRNSLIIDIAIALAAFSFVSTLAVARFISEGRFF